MKNIHILPTDKPSKVYSYKGNLFLTTESHLHVPSMEYQNIYITSDEEIKEGDWFYSVRELIEKAIINYSKGEHFGKIILTTDQDLIADGVQAIDDEFLEWFVKNPSCERVKVVDYPMVEKYNSKGEYIHRNYWTYKIIIPKEEPKQETQGYICPQTKKQCDDECCVSAEDCHIQAGIGILFDPIENQIMLLKEDLLCVHMYLDDLKIPRQSEDNKEYSIVGRIKQLEKKYLKELSEVENHYLSQQDKNKYSEEDLREAYKWGGIYDMTSFEEWFEQFKKK